MATAVMIFRHLINNFCLVQGMVCTCSEDPPPIEAIRCIPEMWTVASKRKPIKLWDDTGAGGGRPGSAWIINDLNMIAIVPGKISSRTLIVTRHNLKILYLLGHNEPSDQFYDVNSNRFFIDGNIIQKLGIEDEEYE